MENCGKSCVLLRVNLYEAHISRLAWSKALNMRQGQGDQAAIASVT